MTLDGAGTRFISALQHAGGRPGGCLEITVDFQPNGTYPQAGELISQFLNMAAMGTNFKVPAGVNPDAVHVSDGPGFWWYDRAHGSLRLWTLANAEATANAAYSTMTLTPSVELHPENISVVIYTARFIYPLFGSMSR